MTRLVSVGIVLGLAGFVAWAAAPAAQDVVGVKAADVKWMDAKGHPKGVKSAVIHGDPAKGAFVAMLKVPAGTLYPPHLHSADEVAFVQSGSATIGVGEKVDESKGMTVDAGGYFQFKGKTAHWAKFTTDTVVIRYSSGAGDITYCNAADDPSKK